MADDKTAVAAPRCTPKRHLLLFRQIRTVVISFHRER